MFPGDVVAVEVDGIGRLENTVVSGPAPDNRHGFRANVTKVSLGVALGSDYHALKKPGEPPTPEQYAHIFERYAEQHAAPVAAGLVERLLDRYQAEKRELRCCEPRDLVERARDICRFMGRPLELNDDVLALAWTGYFGKKSEIHGIQSSENGQCDRSSAKL